MKRDYSNSGNAHTNEARQEPKRPIQSFGPYSVDRSTTIKVAIWENEITVDGRQITVYSCTIQRSYKDAEGWHESHSFRGNDLPVLIHALQQAHAWILEQRNGSASS